MTSMPTDSTDVTHYSSQRQLSDSKQVSLLPARLARWDMRTPEGVVQSMTSPSIVRWDDGKIYPKTPQFNCMATSGRFCWAMTQS